MVEVVTDDMPFLVDSVTMELDRHDIGIHLVVHPQLRVRRDLTGKMREGRAEEDVTGQMLVESWMHIEIDRQSDPEALAAAGGRPPAGAVATYGTRSRTSRRCGTWPCGRAEDLTLNPPPLEPAEVEDSLDLLRWLADGHFTFLGYREYGLESGDGGETLRAVPGAALGILRARQGRLRQLLRAARRGAGQGPGASSCSIITKANSRATVHRAAYLDYIGVKLFVAEGEVIGERRFLGLFTHVAYNESHLPDPGAPAQARRRAQQAGLTPESHDGKDLIEILETYPRDELFQISVDELLPIALGVLRLRERKQVRLFLRRDDYGRYMSCLVYLPRDRYTTKIRLRMQEILLQGAGRRDARLQRDDRRVGAGPAARGGPRRARQAAAAADVDVEELEARLAATTRSWDDDLADEPCWSVRRGGGAAAAAALRAPPSPRATRPTSRPRWPWPTCAAWSELDRRGRRGDRGSACTSRYDAEPTASGG